MGLISIELRRATPPFQFSFNRDLLIGELEFAKGRFTTDEDFQFSFNRDLLIDV